ncbi:MAG: 30S ribosomal protein S3 [Candidatus Kerfeldbacteria bacterium]|nr:30S ribosomal protein S3 [Candidatus Kerfeldbacteria bacterium]
MGQKVHPKSFRLGLTANWNSKWFASRRYPQLLQQDVAIRKFLKSKLTNAGLAAIDIERSLQNLTITIHTAKPGVVIGRGGQGIESLRRGLQMLLMGQGKYLIKLNIQEVQKPELSAQIMVENIADQLSKRIPFRRVLKSSIDQVMQAGAKGVKIALAGRLNGAEIARTEVLSQGSLPLQTLRAAIDYGRGEAHTTYGRIGVKVWVYHGQVFAHELPPRR